jgi:hypothetical protein
MKKLIIALCSLLLTSLVHAQWRTTTYTLKGGWNAIYLPGDATYNTIDNLFPSAVLEVWRWQPNPNGVQFTTSPLTPSDGTAEWATWKRDGSVLTLSRLVGQSTYLVKCSGTTSNTYSVTLKQSPQLPANSWVRNGANLLGFPSFKNGSTYPTMSSYFATFPAAISAGAKVYKYVGGDLGPANPVQIFSTSSERLDATQAYWFSAEVTGNFYAPLEISPSSNAGLVFGRDGSTAKILVRNPSAAVVNISLSPVTSETAPSGQTTVAAAVPLTRRTYNAGTMQWVETPITAAYTESISPNSTVELNFGINRGDATMTAAAADALFASFLRITDSTLLDVYVPVTAQKASQAGLWMGEITLTNVSNKVSNGAQATATITDGVVTGLSVVGSGGFGYTTPPVVTIPAPSPNAAATATAAVGVNMTVTSLTPASLGWGYSSPPNVTISAPPSTSASVTATANATISGGTVSGISLSNSGRNYTSAPTVTLSAPPASSNATAGTPVVSANKTITSIPLGSGGGYYSAAPSVVIGAPTAAVTATAGTVTRSGGTVTAIAVSTAGTNYSTAPAVTIAAPPTSANAVAGTPVVSASKTISSIPVSSGGGHYSSAPSVAIGAPTAAVQATANATVSAGAVSGVAVNNPGTNYSTAPTVTISAPPAGVTATATATVANGSVTGFTVSGGSGYSAAPTVTIAAPPAAVQATATANLNSNGQVGSITVNNAGTNYTSVPSVSVSGGNFTTRVTATANATIANGAVTGFTITNTGAGYIATPTSVTVAAPPAAVQATANATIANGQVTGFTMNNTGTNYTSIPSVTVSGGTFITPVTATATSTLNGTGGIASITRTNVGAGYLTAPTVTISAPPEAATATAQALLTNGAVSGYTITNAGFGYTTAPTVTVDSPPDSIPATATATVDKGSVTGFTVTSGGSGYDKAPAVSVALPPAQTGTSTPNPFKLRTLLHISDGGTYNLLSRVYLGTLAAAPNATGLSTLESKLKADSLDTAMRFSAAHLPPGSVFLGSRSGSSCTFTVTNPYNGATNPFVHKYHPDHDNQDALFQNTLAAGVESPNISRSCVFTFTATPPAGSTTPVSSWGSSVIGGTYSENITGIHKETLNVSGTFELRRASEIGTLSQ